AITVNRLAQEFLRRQIPALHSDRAPPLAQRRPPPVISAKRITGSALRLRLQARQLPVPRQCPQEVVLRNSDEQVPRSMRRPASGWGVLPARRAPVMVVRFGTKPTGTAAKVSSKSMIHMHR